MAATKATRPHHDRDTQARSTPGSRSCSYIARCKPIQNNRRALHPRENDTTVIRRAADVDAKLGKKYSADGSGESQVPVLTTDQYRSTSLCRVGLTGFSSAHDINVCHSVSDSSLQTRVLAHRTANNIVGYDDGARSSALEYWVNTPMTRELSPSSANSIASDDLDSRAATCPSSELPTQTALRGRRSTHASNLSGLRQSANRRAR